MDQKFPASEKLKSKILIDRLFSEGKSVKKFPLKLVYIPFPAEDMSFKTGVSVPKRNFKRAVDRNYLKRLMREAFRKNKYLVYDKFKQPYAFMFIYTGNKQSDLKTLSESFQHIFHQLIEKENGKEKL